VWRKTRRGPSIKSGFPHRFAKATMKRHERRDIPARPQDQWPLRVFSNEAQHMIECDLEGRHGDGGSGLPRMRDWCVGQPAIIAEAKQRHMKTRRGNRPAFQSMRHTEKTNALSDRRGGIARCKDREKQSIPFDRPSRSNRVYLRRFKWQKKLLFRHVTRL
jgi:hypothetical protein